MKRFRKPWLFPKPALPTFEESLHARPTFRDARFCISVPCGWKNGVPEELQVFLFAHLGTMFLGISKASRKVEGYSRRGLERPNLFDRTTPAFFYNLDFKEHVLAFLETFRHLSAFAAATTQDPSWVRNFLGTFEEKIQLCQTRFEPGTFSPKGEKLEGKGYECLSIRKQNSSLPEQLLPKEFWEELNECVVRPLLTSSGQLTTTVEQPPLEEKKWITMGHPWFFKLERYWITKEGNHIPVTGLGTATYLTLPISVVPSLCEALFKLLTYYKSYVSRHPSQLARHRWDTSPFVEVRKTQLYYDERAWLELLPELKDALSPIPEPALWEYPQLYKRRKEPFTRAKHKRKENKKRLHLKEFSPQYLTRLLLFAEKKLCWRHWWGVPKWVAKRDATYIGKLVWKRLAATVRARFVFLAACCALKRKKVPRLKTRLAVTVTCNLLQHSLEEKLGYAHSVEGVARAPPQKCSVVGMTPLGL